MTGARRLPAAARSVLSGDRRALARLMSAVENRDLSALPALRALFSHTGRARIVGVAGPLGVGKSSLINALLALLRARGLRVGVVAVDPTSPFSGGSVLGDRVRLDRDPDDEGVFIRSMASRGHSGGIAAATRDVVRLLDAFGMQVVLVETVGSGQVDLEIQRVASTSIVVVVPHLGDEVQTLKAGLFEIADIFCVNKSDLPGADGAVQYLSELVALGPDSKRWRPWVVPTSATNSVGVDVLWNAVEAHEAHLDASGERTHFDRARLTQEILDLVRDRMGTRLRREFDADPEVPKLVERVVRKSIDPYRAADRLYGGLRRRL